MSSVSTSSAAPAAARTQRIALIPVAAPDTLRSVTSARPYGSRRSSGQFAARMDHTRMAMGAQLTTALEAELKAVGFDVVVMPEAPRTVAGSDKFDYASLPTRDPVLHVTFAEVGIFESRLTGDLQPRLNVWSYLLASAKSQDLLGSGYYHFGADSRGNSAWSIPVEARYRYADIDTLLDNADEVGESYLGALQEIAHRMARQVRSDLPA